MLFSAHRDAALEGAATWRRPSAPGAQEARWRKMATGSACLADAGLAAGGSSLLGPLRRITVLARRTCETWETETARGTTRTSVSGFVSLIFWHLVCALHLYQFTVWCWVNMAHPSTEGGAKSWGGEQRQATTEHLHRTTEHRLTHQDLDWGRNALTRILLFILHCVLFQREFVDSKRVFGERRRNDSYTEEEPEWFSAGPTSQSETIELTGFDDKILEEDHKGRKRTRRRTASVKEGQQDLWEGKLTVVKWDMFIVGLTVHLEIGCSVRSGTLWTVKLLPVREFTV